MFVICLLFLAPSFALVAETGIQRSAYVCFANSPIHNVYVCLSVRHAAANVLSLQAVFCDTDAMWSQSLPGLSFPWDLLRKW